MIPVDVREREYFVIDIPLDESGNGPTSVAEASSIVYEIWNSLYETQGIFEYLSDAIQKCEELNKEYYNDRN